MGKRQSFASWLAFRMSSSKARLKRSLPSLSDSAPMAIPISIVPVMISFAMCCVAVKPDEQNRAAVEAAVVLGKPAASEAARA